MNISEGFYILILTTGTVAVIVFRYNIVNMEKFNGSTREKDGTLPSVSLLLYTADDKENGCLGRNIVKLTDRDLRNMPKVELHRHLDGSVRFDTLLDIARKHNLDLGTKNPEELYRQSKILEPLKDLDTALKAFSTIQKVLCSYDAVKQIACENVEDAFRDGCVLAELRFSPAYIIHGKNMEFDEVLEGVIDGITEGMNKYDIQIGLICIASRGYDLEANQSALDAAITYSGKYHTNADRICGFDLADGESPETVDLYVPLVDKARDAGLGITVHTGENTGPEMVVQSAEAYAPDRIGHGIGISGNRDAEKLIKERNIHLEVSPTSNVLTNSVPSVDKHPLPGLVSRGISASINSDDPQLMDISLVHEYRLCRDIFGFGLDEFRKCNREALEHSFCSEDTKAWVEKKLF